MGAVPNVSFHSSGTLLDSGFVGLSVVDVVAVVVVGPLAFRAERISGRLCWGPVLRPHSEREHKIEHERIPNAAKINIHTHT